MKEKFRDFGVVLMLNIAFVTLLVLFAANRSFGDAMMSIVMPLLIVTSGAIVYTQFFRGDILIAVTASMLLGIGQMLQVLINEKVPGDAELLLFLCPVLGALGIIIVCFLQRPDYGSKKTARVALACAAAAVILLGGILLLFGRNVSGTKAWLVVGGVSLQLTEFFKPLYVLFHAVLWCARFEHRRSFALSTGITVISTALLVIINELGTLLVILLMWIILTFIFSEKLLDAAIALGGTVTLAVCGYAVIGAVNSRVEKIASMGETPGRILLKISNIYEKLHKRFLILSDLDSFQSTEQPVIARRMIIKGGLFGTTDKVWIPVESSDYAFVGLLLRCGIVFGVVVLFLFVTMFIRSVLFAARTQNKFESVMFTGAALSLILPAFVNILGTTNFSFMTGIALPFISHGGTNMMITFFNVMLLIWGSCKNRPDITSRVAKYIKGAGRSAETSPEEAPFTR